jgi:hypothetical protein
MDSQLALLNHLGHFAADILVYDATTGTARSDVRHASGALVRPASQTALITADHVVRRFEDIARAGGKATFQVANCRLDPLARLIWRDRELDVAIVGLTEEESTSTDVGVHQPRAPWPPPLPQVGQFVVLTGYPKELRTHEPDGTVVLPRFIGTFRVNSAFQTHFTCVLDRPNAVGLAGLGVPPQGIDYGGLSGGPVFLDDALFPSIVGVIKEDYPLAEYFHVAGLAQAPAF